ncbi:MAG: hypothetical protein HC880_10165 [Bacteroidia bacterium]|nr:hypothetical protein [Bacteroidia bacterium]
MSLRNHRLVRHWYAEENAFAGLFLLKNHLYVQIRNRGLHREREGKLSPEPSGRSLKAEEIRVAIPYNTQSVLLGSASGQFFRFDGNRLTPYNFEAQQYVTNKLLDSGLEFSADKICVGNTLRRMCTH